MRYYVYYKLADIVIRLGSDFEYFAENSYMSQFLVDAVPEPDYYFDFYKTDNIDTFLEATPNMKAQVYKYHYYQDDAGNEQCFHLNGRYYHAVTIIGEKSGYCYYISYDWMKESANTGYYLENFLCLEKILMKFGCMVLHSCHIHSDGKAILFSAPSGTGKSTQGELWRTYANAEVINGDRTAIRKVDGMWNAYGVPFCGTSGIHENKQAPLNAIVVLRQNKENRVFRLKGRDAFYSIYSELTVNSWNSQFVKDTMDWIMELLQDVPVYGFLCTKDPDAVLVLKEYMKGSKKKNDQSNKI